MSVCFFFNDTATTEIYTLSLHDALPILQGRLWVYCSNPPQGFSTFTEGGRRSNLNPLERCARGGSVDHQASLVERDRKSTRLNSSHANISYAVFCLTTKR